MIEDKGPEYKSRALGGVQIEELPVLVTAENTDNFGLGTYIPDQMPNGYRKPREASETTQE